MSGHVLTVDLSNKSVFITTPEGRTVSAWSGLTRRTLVDVVEADGWTLAGDWELTSPPDGFYCHVTRAEGTR